MQAINCVMFAVLMSSTFVGISYAILKRIEAGKKMRLLVKKAMSKIETERFNAFGKFS